jgi:hypothetical protein
MKMLRIEMDRGGGWELRAEGSLPYGTPTARIEADLRSYAVQHPHRALLDGEMIAAALPGNVTLAMDDTGAFPMLTVTGTKRALTDRIVAMCHALAGECGYCIEFRHVAARQ